MGYSLSWAALNGGTLQMICDACNLQATGAREGIAESNIDAAEIPSGWCLVLFNQQETDDRLLATLSAEGEVVSCFIEDHVMYSSAAGWNRGRQVWKVSHDCEKGRYHLDGAGAPPSELKKIRDRLRQEQDAAGGQKGDVDFIYDVPAEVAKSLTGFRHDQEIAGMVGNVYHILEPVAEGFAKTGPIRGLGPIFRGNQQ
jgi:hypothetical protein